MVARLPAFHTHIDHALELDGVKVVCSTYVRTSMSLVLAHERWSSSFTFFLIYFLVANIRQAANAFTYGLSYQ